MLDYGDNVVVGVSGGADSLALLFSLLKLKDEYGLKLFVAHINHGLREEARGEADYVRALCETGDVPFYLKEVDINALSKEYSMGTEEAGRKVRYDFFKELTELVGGGKIAVAHNQNDLAETMLFNLARGTGIKGLSSIPPKRANVIRPFLCVDRKEIEEFLSCEGVEFCTDKSNFTSEYTRNRIRNIILPSLTENVSKKTVEHMAVTASMLREINEYLEKACDKAFEACLIREDDNGLTYSKERLLKEDEYIQKCLVKRAIDELLPGNRDITHIHLESVTAILSLPGSKKVSLPYRMTVTASYEEVHFEIGGSDKDEFEETEIVPGKRIKLFDGSIVEAKLFEGSKDFDYGQKQYTKCFDYDKINESLVVRARKTNDVICVNSSGGKKKLKDYMIDEKIPAAKRGTIPIIADGSNVWWVVGHRMSEEVKITEHTKKIIVITVFKEE